MSQRPADTPKPSDLLIYEQHDLALSEAARNGGDLFNDDGTIDVVILRPCNGRGLGSRIYEADMLASAADAFRGVASFDNHEAPQAKRARGGMPRSIFDLGGVIRESWWDPAYTEPDDAKHGFGAGAIRGRAALTPGVRALVETIPEAIKLSVNAQATNVRRGRRGGRDGWIVEGIVNDPENTSVDFVTKAGAGGRVRKLLEALADDEQHRDPSGSAGSGGAGPEGGAGGGAGELDELTVEEAPIVVLTDDEIRKYLADDRPHIIENATGEEDGMGLKDVQEALRSDEGRALLAEAMRDAVRAGVEEQLPALRESIRAEVHEELTAASRWDRLARQARSLIEASKLPAAATANLLLEYGVTEIGDGVVPGRALALVEAVKDGDKVTKTDVDVLKERVDADVRARRAEIAEANPTIPWSLGGAAITQGHVDGGDADAARRRAEQSHAQLRESLAAQGLDPEQFGVPAPVKTTTTGS